jgi:hypothetical protein
VVHQAPKMNNCTTRRDGKLQRSGRTCEVRVISPCAIPRSVGPTIQTRALRPTWTELGCYKGELLYNATTLNVHYNCMCKGAYMNWQGIKNKPVCQKWPGTRRASHPGPPGNYRDKQPPRPTPSQVYIYRYICTKIDLYVISKSMSVGPASAGRVDVLTGQSIGRWGTLSIIPT